MNISRPFILRPIATSLLMVAIMFSGFLAFRLLPVSVLPEVDYPTIRVATYYPGANPDVMTSLVTAPLERQFGQMPGLNQMTSTSSRGLSIVTLQFNLSLSLDIAEQEVQAAINAATNFLPKDLPNPPIYSKVNPANAPIMTLALTSSTMALSAVEDLAETRFSQKISQIGGVGLVSISGGKRPAVRIQANPLALSSYGLTMEDIRSTVSAANTNQPKGTLDGRYITFELDTNDQLVKSEDYGNLLIAYKKGAPVRLSDVASVIDGIENTQQAAWFKREPAILLNIQQQPGANIIQVVDRIQNLLPQLKASLPAGVNLSIVGDRTQTIRASVREAQMDLIISVFLVVIVIFLFLRSPAATLIACLAIPLALVGSLGFMYLFGFSLNNLTIMALTIAAGFVVDDTIVMVENTSRYLEGGHSPMDSALLGAKQVGFTILSLTISLIAVLIPLLFMKDLIGRLFREFAITLSITILISGFVALTLTPMLCSRMLNRKNMESKNAFMAWSDQAIHWVIEKYRITLAQVLTHQPLVLFITICTIGINVMLFYEMPKGLFPEQDTGVIQGISQASPAISFTAMTQHQQALAEIIMKDEDVENLISFIGIDGTNLTMNSGRLQIILKPLDKRVSSIQAIMARLAEKCAKLPNIKLFMQPSQDLIINDRITRTQYQFSLESPEQKDVNYWTEKLVKSIEKSAHMADVTSDIQLGGLLTLVTVDRKRAFQYGASMQTINNALYDAFGQRQISTMYTQRNQYYVVIELEPHLQTSNNPLNHIFIPTGTGNTVPLSAIAHVTQKSGPLVNTRQGQFPAATISFNLKPGASLGDAVTELERIQAQLDIPKTIVTSFEGAAHIFQSAVSNEGFLMLAAMVTVYIILGILYESYIHPLTILSTLPSAGIGALLALFLGKHDISIVAIIGIILLIGIVMKNAIMMIDFALELERTRGKPAQEAIYEAALLRFRPILMTTMAAIFGAFPLAFGNGYGSELRHPLGIAIIGGLVLSQILTLYSVPVIYLAFDRLGKRLGVIRPTPESAENI